MFYSSRDARAAAVAAAAVALCAVASPATSAEFTFDEKVNEQMAKKLNIPVHFAVPGRARAPLAASFDTTDTLVDFKHPDAIDHEGNVSLRLIVAKRSGFSQRMGKSGLIQTGDVLLTFRSEWGGAGAYPNIQMGISHTAIAYVKDGSVYHLDNPLNSEYLGRGLRGDFTSEHYRTLDYLHVIRPRDLTAAEKANIEAWGKLVQANASRIYQKNITFNSDYNAPKYGPGKPLDFVKLLAQAALGQNPSGKTDLYCSEFVWSMLALRDCDPASSANAFSDRSVPSCVKSPLEPMEATGNFMSSGGSRSYSGMADGPLMVIDAMHLPKAERTERLEAVFRESPGGLAKLSSGHRKVAEEMKPRFTPLEQYYLGVTGGGFFRAIKARVISKVFRLAVPENYSPTSFLVNTMLPRHNKNRTMDYVATVVFQ